MFEIPVITMDRFIDFVSTLPPSGIYFFIGISVFLENIFPPWPSDVILVFAGFLAGQGLISDPTVYFSILAGNLMGAYTMYYGGSWVIKKIQRPDFVEKSKKTFLEKIISDFANPIYLSRAEVWFRRFGFLFVFFSRFFAGIRFFVGIVAGASRMNPLAFGIAFGGGALLWSGILYGGGKALGENWEQVLEYVKMYNTIFMILGSGVFIGVILYKISSKKRPRTEGLK